MTPEVTFNDLEGKKYIAYDAFLYTAADVLKASLSGEFNHATLVGSLIKTPKSH